MRSFLKLATEAPYEGKLSHAKGPPSAALLREDPRLVPGGDVNKDTGGQHTHTHAHTHTHSHTHTHTQRKLFDVRTKNKDTHLRLRC